MFTPSDSYLLPYQSHFIKVDQYDMHYFDEGDRDAPVVIALHGNPTWSYYYRNLIKRLATKYRVVAPDHIGCGLSDHPNDVFFTAKDRVKHLIQLIEQLKIKRFSLVMHDWGGPIGTRLAQELNVKVEKLVYLNTILTGTDLLPGFIKRAAAGFIGKTITKYTKQFVSLTTDWGVSKTLSPYDRKMYHMPYQRISDRQAIWGFVSDIPFEHDHASYDDMLSMGRDLNLLKDKETLILWGLNDPCFHRGIFAEMQRLIPHAQVKEFPSASHLLLEDHPKEIADQIEAFFDSSIIQELAEKKNLKIDHNHSATSNPLVRSFLEYASNHLDHEALLEETSKGNWKRITYVNFASEIRRYTRALKSYGLTSADRVLFLVPPGAEFLQLSYAIMASGAVPVFLDPGMGIEKLLRCIKDADVQGAILSPRAQVLRLLDNKLFSKLKFCITASENFFIPGVTLRHLKRFSDLAVELEATVNDIALVAYTSGATGTPKGVIFTNQNLEAQCKIFSDTFNLKSGTTDLSLLPIFSLYTMALGIKCVIPKINPAKPLSFDPRSIAAAINDHKVNSCFGSPTLWDKLSEFSQAHAISFPSLKIVMMAGAPVSRQTLERVQKLLPNGEAYTPYGSTEALPVSLVSAAQIMAKEPVYAKSAELGVYLGRAISAVKILVVEISQHGQDINILRECANTEIGELIVSADNVSKAYLNSSEANKIAKLNYQGADWHRMGDLVYLDFDNGLYFCGRKAHQVIHEQQIYCSVTTERIYNQHPRVKRSALIKTVDSQAAIVIEPLVSAFPKDDQAAQNFAAELRQLAKDESICQGIEKIFFHPSFPVDARHNAKIFRDKLGEWSIKAKSY